MALPTEAVSLVLWCAQRAAVLTSGQMGSMLALADLFHIQSSLPNSEVDAHGDYRQFFADEICIRSMEPNGFNDEGTRVTNPKTAQNNHTK